MNKKETNTPQTVFELTEIRYNNCYDENDEFVAPKYPEFEVHKCKHGLFSTLAKAEQSMKKRIKERHYDSKEIFGFKIDEFYLDMNSGGIYRIYLPDGSFLDESLVVDLWDEETGRGEEFFGRPAEKMRFQKGDLAEYLCGDTVSLVIVCEQPLSPEYVSEWKERHKKKFKGESLTIDSGYDIYFAHPFCEKYDNCLCEKKDVCGNWYCEPFPTSLFPVRFPVSDEIRSTLEKQYQKCQSLAEKKDSNT